MQHEDPNRKEVRMTEEFETDAQKIVRRHLENENDIITDEDIRSVRIGITPHLEESSEEKMNELMGEEDEEELHKPVIKKNPDSNEGTVTSWDTIQQ